MDDDGYCYGKYREWVNALNMASDGGAIDFH
jgi:hypothetical protein